MKQYIANKVAKWKNVDAHRLMINKCDALLHDAKTYSNVIGIEPKMLDKHMSEQLFTSMNVLYSMNGLYLVFLI